MEACHCGAEGVGKCPCCDKAICATHALEAARALAEAVGVSGIARAAKDLADVVSAQGRKRVEISDLTSVDPTPPDPPG